MKKTETINKDRIKLIIINGPTAVGKTAVSVELAKLIGGEIISADSMQVYRGMDIGTAKVTYEEMKGIPHHLIDILEPDEEFGVISFKEMAQKKINEITDRGNVPIICGGTGFYIQAVLYDIEFIEYDEAKQRQIREKLEKELAEEGALVLYERLKGIDPEYAAIIHPNNTGRLLHSLETWELTGKRMSEHNKEQRERKSPYDFRYFALTDDREKIYERINKRVDRMIEAGLEQEVRTLLDKGYSRSLQSMQGIGYKEMADHIAGEISLDEAIYDIKRETRHYAKKQLTWFKRERDVEFADRREFKDNGEIAGFLSESARSHKQ
ncbi:MAG: tRNA (adenosine(37)-N6)-dimethylallyltransferase MiaA [Lachnospiraceae bacterium]|nr:tRNA (adenosine(37)-N6)-dimethylallyltransferase MiaA [Lachnospiraceae bacterium]